ncbi:guanine nucleotide-binding protein-like 3 isoform X1 [Electrophorus electricus]|uniref:Guanine nucleotide-binding protein-like 3 n=1 Tax=Electrophorus electricus TaxID=8005 RepID=A0A4W4EEL0_ELEEL|nr:guanine nucleotide-binding protein-like 3 isoform X1 [Electrophorus electricus]
MKRPKLKKASKRLSCAKRFKILKKVREHHRKVRKEAKKSGIRRKAKKDIGVPNSAPFKEEVLREAEQKKQELEELREKNRLAKQKERAEKRKQETDGTAADAEPKSKKAKKEEKAKAQKQARAAVAKKKSTKKFRCSELNKVIEAADVIVEVLDARDPLGCRCPQLEEAVLKHGGKKRLLLVLNKIDLVPKDNLEKWLEYLQVECPTLVFKSTTCLQDRTVLEKKQRDASGLMDHSRAGLTFGRDSLMQTLNDLASKECSDGMLKVGVVGFPNVGKSSIINSLKGIRVCCAGVQRGMTRCMQEVHISKKVKMIDSPAIVAAPSNSGEKLALRSLRVEEEEESPAEAARVLLKQCTQEHIMLQYNVPDYRNSLEFLTFLAKKRGYLQKGALPNVEQAAAVFLGDWTGAKLSYYNKTPERRGLPPHLTNAMVTEMHRGLNMGRIHMANEQIIKRVRCPNQAFSICFSSKGLTAGLLRVSEIPEEKVVTEEDISEQTQDMEGTKEVKTPDSERTLPQQTVQQESMCKQIKGMAQPVSVNTDLLEAQRNNDDAYDFSTDFV